VRSGNDPSEKKRFLAGNGKASINRARFKFRFRVRRTVCDRPPESSRFGAHAELHLFPTEVVRLGVWLLAGGAPGMGRKRLEPGSLVELELAEPVFFTFGASSRVLETDMEVNTAFFRNH
jgi:hypothetical protein